MHQLEELRGFEKYPRDRFTDTDKQQRYSRSREMAISLQLECRAEGREGEAWRKQHLRNPSGYNKELEEKVLGTLNKLREKFVDDSKDCGTSRPPISFGSRGASKIQRH